MKIADVFAGAVQVLVEADIPNPKRSVEELFAHLLHCRPLDVYMYFERNVPSEFHTLLKERERGKPIEYIVGFVDFDGHRILVDERVLIPRPETELLIEKVACRVHKPKRILDLCTGSGCLAVALSKRFPKTEVMAADISLEALAVAQKNGPSLTCVQSNGLHSVEGVFNLIVCNPPYISQRAYESLDKTVRVFEPKVALTSGETGLEFYEHLKKEYPRVLDGLLAVEFGYDQKEALAEMFPEAVFEKDLSGHNRFFFLEYYQPK